MSSQWFDYGREVINKYSWTVGGGVWRILAVSPTYMTSIATYKASHRYVGDITGVSGELSGTGYARQTLTTLTRSVDTSGHACNFLADSITFAGFNAGTIAGLVLYHFGTNDADSEIVCCEDNPDIAGNGGSIVINWNSIVSNGPLFAT